MAEYSQLPADRLPVVRPILATNKFLIVVAETIAGKIAPPGQDCSSNSCGCSPQARIVELSVVAVEPLTDELP